MHLRVFSLDLNNFLLIGQKLVMLELIKFLLALSMLSLVDQALALQLSIMFLELVVLALLGGLEFLQNSDSFLKAFYIHVRLTKLSLSE